MDRKHIYYLDYLRIFAALSVVWMHTASSGLQGEPTLGWQAMNLVTSLAFTAVPLFFMISGYLLLSDPRTAEVSTLKTRLPRLIVPLACWTVVAALWNCYYQRDWSAAFLLRQLADALYQPIFTPYWFLYTLIAIYLISPLLRGALAGTGKGGARLVVVLAALVSLRAMLRPFLPDEWQGYLNLNFLVKLSAWGGYLLLFLLGRVLGNLERRIDNRLLIGAALVCYAVIVVGTWRGTVSRGSYFGLFQDQSAGFEVVLAVCLFLLAKQNLDRPCRFVERSGLVPLLFPVYLIHAPALRVMTALVYSPQRFLAVAGVTAALFVLCLLAAKTIVSVPFLCYPLTGLPYRKTGRRCGWFSSGA